MFIVKSEEEKTKKKKKSYAIMSLEIFLSCKVAWQWVKSSGFTWCQAQDASKRLTWHQGTEVNIKHRTVFTSSSDKR